MMKLDELFHVRNGIVSSGLNIQSGPFFGSIPYLRPANTQQRTISGWISKSDVEGKNIYPEGSLFVSTNGEGSHTYSYVSSFEFACNSDVSILIPKIDMGLRDKIFYARCITMNRYLFSYGRKPKGKRLKEIEIPNAVPDWVKDINTNETLSVLDDFKNNTEFPFNEKSERKLDFVPVNSLFDVRYGHSLELNRLDLLSRRDGGIPFVSRKMGGNGISSYVAPIDSIPPAPAGELTCALSGNGVLSTFYQETPFYTGFHVACLRPLFEMSREELLYYCSCIWQNRNKFSYGRQANRTLKDLLVPSRDSVPHWVYGALSRITEQVISSSAR
ncbi:restriction endonuclease subunit S [Pectobacterium atrosepticum]|nr:restriction endonuclease subunit S [Pectobacterium atrosepticum]MCA6979455.1 restriction endonuclease subunit S [Pectobacterium atrosepticum]MDK9443046.1 restriction endonuclease subunit S [Pectobacterium atrosepticum]